MVLAVVSTTGSEAPAELVQDASAVYVFCVGASTTPVGPVYPVPPACISTEFKIPKVARTAVPPPPPVPPQPVRVTLGWIV